MLFERVNFTRTVKKITHFIAVFLLLFREFRWSSKKVFKNGRLWFKNRFLARIKNSLNKKTLVGTTVVIQKGEYFIEKIRDIRWKLNFTKIYLSIRTNLQGDYSF